MDAGNGLTLDLDDRIAPGLGEHLVEHEDRRDGVGIVTDEERGVGHVLVVDAELVGDPDIVLEGQGQRIRRVERSEHAPGRFHVVVHLGEELRVGDVGALLAVLLDGRDDLVGEKAIVPGVLSHDGHLVATLVRHGPARVTVVDQEVHVIAHGLEDVLHALSLLGPAFAHPVGVGRRHGADLDGNRRRLAHGLGELLGPGGVLDLGRGVLLVAADLGPGDLVTDLEELGVLDRVRVLGPVGVVGVVEVRDVAPGFFGRAGTEVDDVELLGVQRVGFLEGVADIVVGVATVLVPVLLEVVAGHVVVVMPTVGRAMTDPVHVAGTAPIRAQFLELLQLGGAVGEVLFDVVAVGREHEAARGVKRLVDEDLDPGGSGGEGGRLRRDGRAAWLRGHRGVIRLRAVESRERDAPVVAGKRNADRAGAGKVGK
ncbi:hypothetical protein D3C87_1027710 [compost metagenome]